MFDRIGVQVAVHAARRSWQYSGVEGDWFPGYLVKTSDAWKEAICRRQESTNGIKQDTGLNANHIRLETKRSL
jgi:hypothetical protein